MILEGTLLRNSLVFPFPFPFPFPMPLGHERLEFYQVAPGRMPAPEARK